MQGKRDPVRKARCSVALIADKAQDPRPETLTDCKRLTRSSPAGRAADVMKSGGGKINLIDGPYPALALVGPAECVHPPR